MSGSADNYSYDAFDRLTSAVRTTTSGKGGFTLSYGYDVYGNLTHKSDAGNMTYDPTNNRLQSLDKTNGTQKRYSYDANGNMLQAGDNGVKWTSFNQPLEIRNASTHVIVHTPCRKRGQSALTYLASVISAARAGFCMPALPQHCH